MSNIVKLFNILDDLSKYKRQKDFLKSMYIQNRLNESLVTYYKSLNDSFFYLKNKDGFNVMKNFGGDKNV